MVERAVDCQAPGAFISVSRFTWQDEYVGTMADLVAAGVAPPDWFPGQPGRGKTSATFFDGKPAKTGPKPHDERHVSIQRISGGKYRVQVGLAREEWQRRRAAADADKVAREAAAEAMLAELSSNVRRYCDQWRAWRGDWGIEEGERRFSDPAYLASERVCRQTAALVLVGFRTFREAAIERELHRSSFGAAKALIAKVRG